MDDMLQSNLYVTWDRMNTIWFRYWSYYEETGKTLTGDAVNKHIRNFEREVHFLIRRSCDLEFHQYLNSILDYTKKKGRKDGLVIQKHMKELTRYVLLDKIMQKEGKFLTTKDILSKKDDETDNQEYLSYGHLHRMVNDYYPELLTTRIELRERLGKRKYDNDRKIEDHRERIIETQFTLPEKIPPGIFEIVVVRAMRKEATPKFLDQMNLQANMMQKFMMCDPVDLAKLVEFREDVCEIIDELGVNPFLYEDDSVDWKVFRNSGMFDGLVQYLFHQIRILVELRWFREKSEEIQDKLIYREPNYPKYRKKDAEKAVNMAFKWYKRPELVIQIMAIASVAYDKCYREILPNVGLWLSQQCLSQLDLSDGWRAHVLYNIGICHFHLGQERLMLRKFDESVRIFEKIGGHLGDIADAYGYIAGYWRIKNPHKYRHYRDLSETLIQDANISKRRRLIHYRLLSDCAYMHKDKAWEKKLYELGLKHSLNDPDLKDFSLWFSQCLNDFDFLGERGPEKGLGRYPPPQELDTIRSSPSFRGTILDPDP